MAPGAVGPIESALRTHGGVVGLALGAYGEASQSVEALLEWCAGVAAAAQWQRLGYTSKERCRAAFLCGYRDRVAAALSVPRQSRALARQHALGGRGSGEPVHAAGRLRGLPRRHHIAPEGALPAGFQAGGTASARSARTRALIGGEGFSDSRSLF